MLYQYWANIQGVWTTLVMLLGGIFLEIQLECQIHKNVVLTAYYFSKAAVAHHPHSQNRRIYLVYSTSEMFTIGWYCSRI